MFIESLNQQGFLSSFSSLFQGSPRIFAIITYGEPENRLHYFLKNWNAEHILIPRTESLEGEEPEKQSKSTNEQNETIADPPCYMYLLRKKELEVLWF